VEAGVDPLFRVLTEGQAERLFKQAFDGWMQRELEQPGEGVRRSLRRGSRGFRPGDADADGPIERLRRAAYDLAEWRDFRGVWTREPFDREGQARQLAALVRACADASANPSYAGDNLYVDTEPVRRLSREIKSQIADPESQNPEAVDELEAQLIELRRNRDFKRGRKGSGPTYSKGVPRTNVLAARDALVEALNDFQLKADADLAALLHGELFACVDEYEQLKAREGAMDFVDLLLKARDLIRGNAAVRAHFQQRFRAIFVDEFQDTDPLQAELLLLLASADPTETRWEHVAPSPGKLFIVGDPKQSIYRFRRADVDTYLRVCAQLERAGARRLELRRSFRGVPNIQRVVNQAFAPIMDGNPDTLQARYVPLEASREDHPGQPSVVALPVPYPYSNRYVSGRQIEESLPDAVGAYVAWLVTESGWTVTERRAPGVRVPLEARHICILFRRFLSYGEDMTRPYVEALEARGIRHLLVGGRTFHDREEIETLRAALMAIEWPDDQLSVFATLRGALFAIGDEELLEYFDRARSFHPFRIPADVPQHLECVTEALSTLATLHRGRNHRPVADTISSLLEATRAHVGFVLRPGGEQALANVLHVAELARQYELDGGMSFRGFVDTLHAEASTHRPAEAPILEEGSDGVRLMTVHKAKGLEFPVVILADMTARLTPYDASRHINGQKNLCAMRIGGWAPTDLNDARDVELRREGAEGERVAYVAATRARDLLVVPAIGDTAYTEGWIAPLNRALYPSEDIRREQRAASGCPVFKSKDTVLKRPDGDPASFLTMCPGLHETGEGDEAASVVWWSPDALTVGVEASLGLRRDDLIVKDVSPEVLRRQLDTYKSWQESRRAAVEQAVVPSVRVRTATEWARKAGRGEGEREEGAGVPISVEAVAPEVTRPGGVRFGSLVHAVLAGMPVVADAGSIGSLSRAHGRILSATDDEMTAAATVAMGVAAHPIWRQARQADAAGQCYRETPVTLRVGDTLIEGNVDLAFVDGEEVIVVDFKTDREVDGALDVYTRQVQTYAAAVGAALGKKPRGVLLRV
jgi:ATP-dependent helicase/nuclease subunit A